MLYNFEFDPWQKEFLKTEGDKILCCGRQVGKSVTCGKDAADYAVNNPKSQPIVMIAPTERQAYALFDKTLDYLITNYKDEVVLRGKDRPTKTKIKLKSGVLIYCLPVGLNGLGIRFLTIGRLYADEAARIPQEVWDAVTPALLTTGGSSIYLSTPAGKQGEFYDCWINKKHAYDSFKRFSIDSRTVVENRKISDIWTKEVRKKAIERLDMEKKRKSEIVYAQEYMGQFMDELSQLFKDSLIKERMVAKRQGTRQGKYVMGVDVGGMGGDLSTFEIFRYDKNRLIQVENKTLKKVLTTDTSRKVIELDSIYRCKEINVDGQGIGFGVYSELREHPQTRRKVVDINNAKKTIDKDGRKGKLYKEEGYMNLLNLMENGEIDLLDDQEIFESLRSVQLEIQDGGKLRIFGDDTHIAEGIWRAAWFTKSKNLNIYIY